MTLLLASCKKERTFRMEAYASVGEFTFTRPSYDPNQIYDTTSHPGGTFAGHIPYSKKRGDYYYCSINSLADSSVTVLLLINVYYDDELIDTKQLTAANQPMLEISGTIP